MAGGGDRAKTEKRAHDTFQLPRKEGPHGAPDRLFLPTPACNAHGSRAMLVAHVFMVLTGLYW